MNIKSAWLTVKRIMRIIKKNRSALQHVPPSLRTPFGFCTTIFTRQMWGSKVSTKVRKNYEDLINTNAYDIETINFTK